MPGKLVGKITCERQDLFLPAYGRKCNRLPEQLVRINLPAIGVLGTVILGVSRDDGEQDDDQGKLPHRKGSCENGREG